MQKKNELCSCGSGKKYKRCCEQVITSDKPKNKISSINSLMRVNKNLKIQLDTSKKLLKLLYERSAEARHIINKTQSL